MFCGKKILFQYYAHDIFRTSILSFFGLTNPFLKHAQNIKAWFYVSITWVYPDNLFMPISHGFWNSLSCGEASISNIFLPTGMKNKTRGILSEYPQLSSTHFLSYPGPFQPSFKDKHWHSSETCGRHTLRTLLWMEDSVGRTKGAIVLIFLKKCSLSSSMTGIEKFLLYFTST